MDPSRHRAPAEARYRGTGVLVRGALATLVVGGAAASVGFAVSGPDAGRAAALGTLVVVAVCATGSLLVDAVAGVLPAASILVALLTYTLQVLVVLLVFVGLERSELLGTTLDRGWLGGAAIGTTLAWLGIQVLLSTRQRIPVYELPARDHPVTGVVGRSGATEAGDR